MKISKSEYEWLLGIINTLERDKSALEKALDKACVCLIRSCDQDCYIFDEYADIPDNAYTFDQVQWKEWLMKDETD